MGSLFQEKNVNRTVVSNVTFSIAQVTNPGRGEPVTMSPATTKVTLNRQTRGLRVSRGGKLAMGTDIVGAVFSIVTSTKAPKALDKERSWVAGDRDVKEMSGSRYYWVVVTNMHNKGLISCNCILV